MTTERQRIANQRNAKRSTGPKTVDGKATSSANARQHGLAGAIDFKSIVSWYRVILNDGKAIPDPFELDANLLAAVELARSEAQLQHVRAAEERWYMEPVASSDPRFEELSGILRQLHEVAATFESDPIGSALVRVKLLRIEIQERKRLRISHEKIGHSLARYRAAAEAQRRKALTRWIDQVVLRGQSG